MIKFYEKVLPSQGVYCVTGINSGTNVTKNKFAETLDEFLTLIETFNANGDNVFFNPASFIGHSRKNDNVKFLRSFYVDLDVGEGKGYPDQESALYDLNVFLEKANLPDPVIINSGRGVHAYWIFDQDIPVDEWKPYAEKFKMFCMDNGLLIDPVVTAHQARIMRCPDTQNHKTNPPSPTSIVSDDINVYDFAEFKEFLGEIDMGLQALLASIPKGLDDDTRAIKGLDNFETTFAKIAVRSLEGDGCAQIVEILTKPNDIHYDQWTAGLSIARHCDDGEEAIHLISEDSIKYNREATIEKANEFDGPRGCKWFIENFPAHCEGCKFKGEFTGPIALGKSLKIAKQPTENQGPVREKAGATPLPQALYPYVRGETGGIYKIVEGAFDKNTGTRTAEEPILVSRYDLYPIKRIFSGMDGECLLMRAVLPNDAAREFLLPVKHIYATEKFKEIMASNGVLFDPTSGAKYLMSYIIKWGDYFITKDSAEIMRTQMGWVEGRKAFVVGEKEVKHTGDIISAPTSPLCRGVVKHLHTAGTFEQWKTIANNLNKDGFELHAFTLLAAFGSTLMEYTSTSGVTMCLTGDSGNAKTGALYSQLSAWGNPKDLSVVEDSATGNGMVGRYLALHNIPFGLDEVGNMDSKMLSRLVLSISHGKAKIRMQSSVNAEREHEMSASLISTWTSNHSMYDKLTTYKKDPKGEVARLIEFSVRRPQALVNDPSLGKAMFDPFNYNYGWAGPEFVKAVMKMSDEEVLERIDYWQARFRKHFGIDTTYRFYENLLTACLAAGTILHEAGILSYDLERIYKVVVGEMITIRDKVVKVNHVDYEALIGDFLNTHSNSMLVLNNGNVSMEPRGPLMIRAEVDQNVIYISTMEFNKYLNEMQVSVREFGFQMEQSGYKVSTKRKKLGAGWKSSAGAVNVWTYAFDTSNFAKDIYEVGHIEVA